MVENFGGRVGQVVFLPVSRLPLTKEFLITWWFRYDLRNERSGLLNHRVKL
jgi:hypothetical protein